MKIRITIVKDVTVERVRPAAKQQPSVVPIEAPRRPTPAKSKERADSKSNAERKVRAANAPPRVESRPKSYGIPID